MGRLHVKFHQDRCKGEAVMRLKPFYLTAQFLHCDLDLWPFDPKVHRAHTWLMGRLHVKFHEDRCKGEAFIRLKPFYLTARLQTDGRTDRRTDRVIPVYPPPNFVAGGIINVHKLTWLYNPSFEISLSTRRACKPLYCKHGYFHWKISLQKSWLNCSRGGNFHDFNVFLLLISLRCYFHAREISTIHLNEKCKYNPHRKKFHLYSILSFFTARRDMTYSFSLFNFHLQICYGIAYLLNEN